MANLVKECFPDKTLYEVIGASKSATAAALKKAYHRAALAHHPDKNAGNEEATKKFQAISFAHSILSDAGKRAEYDRTGSIDDLDNETDEASFALWFKYWRDLFPPVTVADITEFESTYRLSEEERKDVLAAYVKCKGDVDAMLSLIMCSRDEDVPRYVAMVHAAIAAGDAKPLPAFTALYGAAAASSSSATAGAARRVASARARADAARASRSAAEAAEAEAVLAEARAAFKRDKAAEAAAGAGGAIVAAKAVAPTGSHRGAGGAIEGGSSGGKRSRAVAAAAAGSGGGGGEPSLEDLIRHRGGQRAAGFGDMLASLAAKYGGDGKGGAGKGRGGDVAAGADGDNDREEDEVEEAEETAASSGPANKRTRASTVAGKGRKRK